MIDRRLFTITTQFEIYMTPPQQLRKHFKNFYRSASPRCTAHRNGSWQSV